MTAAEQMLAELSRDWQATRDIAERWGRSRASTLDTLNGLLTAGKVEGVYGGGHRKYWRVSKASRPRLAHR